MNYLIVHVKYYLKTFLKYYKLLLMYESKTQNRRSVERNE